MSIKKVVELIEKSSTIAILPHIYADGDASGSSLAFAIALRNKGKKVDLIMEEDISNYYRFLPGLDLIKLDTEKRGHDLVIALDCGDIGRLGARKDIFKLGKKTINIDHHQTNTKFADINYVIKNASSTGEILYDIIKDLDVKMDKFIAMCLYVAISTDTGGFKFSNTTFKSHEIASHLIRYDINIADISRKLYDIKPLKKVKLLSEMLSTLKLVNGGSISIAHITKEMFEETGTTLEDTDQLVNTCLDIEGVKVAVLIKYEDEHYQKTNLRTCTDYDVSKLAGKFGGGGHAKAAGFRSTDSIEKLEEILSKEISKGIESI